MPAHRSHYVTSPDRAGLALAAGGGLAGLVVVGLIAAGGQHALWALVGGWLIGSLFAMCAIVGIAGPVWLALHALHRRGPLTAALTGAVLALVLLLIAQSWGAADDTYHHIASTLGISGLVALAAAVIGWTMLRIAYERRV